MNVYQYLLEQAAQHLNQGNEKIADGKWFDALVAKLNTTVQDSTLDNVSKQATLEALSVLIKNKHLVVGLGLHTFTLLTYEVSIGKSNSALENYIKALGSPSELIALMNAGADGVVKAKKRLDELHANANQLVFDILISAAKFLLPFLLSSI